jgi:hypothetical protein
MADKVTWRNTYTVLKPEDNDQLEANAAQHEFRGGLTQDQSEARAHQDYLKNHAVDSAAHHLLGMRAAMAVGHTAAAKRHGEAYGLAMSHLGYNPLGAPPKDILDRSKDIQKSPYSFKAHQADEFFAPKVEIPGTKEPTEQDRTLELIEKLKTMRAKPQEA